MKEWAARHLQDAAGPQPFVEFSEVVCAAVTYEPGVTQVHDAASDVVARGRGVCQDHAHVYLACCRSAGVPARYVSGYLYTEAAGHVASHAWVDVWLGEVRGVRHGGGQESMQAIVLVATSAQQQQ